LVFFRFKSSQQGIDQHLGHLQFFFFDQAGVGAEFFDLPDLIRVIHGVQQNTFGARAQNHDVLAVVHGNLGHSHTAALAQRFKEQGIGLLTCFVGRQIVRAL
jgi:hypothetical protein